MTLSMVVEHLSMVVFAIVIAILIGVPLGLLCYLSRAARGVVLRVVDLIQTTPALALLGIIMVTPLGAGKPTVILGLALYSLLPIVRNVTLGLSQVSPAVKEAAKGMGMTRVYSLFHVELPLAMPMLFTGLRIAVVNAIGTAVFASSVGGGLGNLINTGIRRNDVAMILSGTAALMAMALLLDGEPQFLICPGGLILNTDKV
ncbi:ABC transporter permease subunit, partial [Faecalibacterium prausnitzii]|nr:ABC transporter permease subunit [Faecalibacterium prausnitzii]